MQFTVDPQSGYDQPNSINGLLIWLDASEAGTLSRSGTSATKMFDKSPGGYILQVMDDANKPKILQSRFKGKTVVRFDGNPQFLVGPVKPNMTQNFIVIGVTNGELVVDCMCCIDSAEDGITIPSLGYTGPFEIAELLVYDLEQITKSEIDWICEYLCVKWDIVNPNQHHSTCKPQQ